MARPTLSGVRPPKVVVSGGLAPHNVRRAVATVRPYGVDGPSHVVRGETAREDYLGPRPVVVGRHDARGLLPFEGLARLTLAPPGGAVKEDGSGDLTEAQHLEALGDAELKLAVDGRGGRELDRLDHGQVIVREVLRVLRAMELQRAEPHLRRHRLDVRGGVIPEDAHGRHEGREIRDDGSGGRRFHIARRLLHEDEAQGVGSRLHRAAGVGDARDPADLDPDHPRGLRSAGRPASRRASSRTLARTSWARTSPSPTRTAWAPALTTRCTSSRVKMPLSLTAVWALGMCGRRARDGPRLVSRV